MKTSRNTIIVIGVLVLLAVILRHPGYVYLNNAYIRNGSGIDPSAAWSLSMVAVGIITFFGFMWLSFKQEGQNVVTKEGLRLAIVSAFIVVDLVLMATVIFPYPAGTYSDLAKDIISQFNWTVGIIVAFYFGTSALAQGRDKEKDKNENDRKDPEETK